MAGVRVRVLDGDDWAAWRDIRLRALRDSPAAFASTYDRERSFTEADWRGRLEDPDSVSVLAYDDEVPLAMGAAFPDLPGLLHVVAMWVEPAARGRGGAHAVLDAIEDWARPRGRRLHLHVNTTNLPARTVFERHGFVGTGETRPMRDGSDEIMERMVLPDRAGSRPAVRR
jgi:GNAT superfamily N-acetyltransferase